MIRISGSARLDVGFAFDLDMTEEQWDALSERKQNEIIDELLGPDELQSAEMTDCDVYDLIEIDKEESA